MAWSQDQFRAIISGRRTDARARVARQALRLASLGYEGAIRVRNSLYDRRLVRTHSVGAVVLSVGNLTAGGTGKTPLVIWLCRALRERQIRCAILTRGYKTPRGEISDEPALLAAQSPGAAVIVNPDRVAGAVEAICLRDAQALVMDDGFQHRRLGRDLDIIAIDATQPFGYGKILPAGLLREPITGLRRAHAVVLTRCDQMPQATLEQIEENIHRVNPDLAITRSIHAPVGITSRDGAEIGLAALRGKRVLAFCGIGNPPSFFHTVEHLGGVLIGSRVFDDHHPYRAGEIEQIQREAVVKGAALILTTQKDWTKIAKLAFPQGRVPLAYLVIELQIIAGAQELTALLDRAISSRIPTP